MRMGAQTMTLQEFNDIDFDDLIFLGRGSWTSSFKLDEETVILKSDCKVKAAISQGLFPESPLFPEIEKVFYDEEEDKTYYIMDFLEIGKYGEEDDFRNQLNKKSKEVWDHLMKFNKDFKPDYYSVKDKMTRLEYWIKAFTEMLSKTLSELMINALNICDTEKTGDVALDIPMHNVGHKNGQLVLFDCFANFGYND